MPALPEASGPDRISAGEDEVIEPDKLEKLKTLLTRRAIENREALEELLEGVPESVKPILRQAIQQAIDSYEQALNSLD